MGASTLITGDGGIHENINFPVYYVGSAIQMLEAAQQHFEDAEIFIFSAAVADYRPHAVSEEKIKKDDDALTITLVKIPI